MALWKILGKEVNMDELRISLAAARVNASLTQKELAEAMHVSRATIMNWESGKVIPKPAQLRMFCDLCGISVDHIFLPYVSL